MRRDLKIATGLGVSLRRFQGWEPTRTVEYVYDGSGRLTGAVERVEPEFSKEQYELHVALHEYEQSVDDYGFPLEESMSILADPNNPEGEYRFVARPVRLWSHQALVDAQADPKWSGENYNPARRWRVEKVAKR